ncbi:hypothetical protein WT81_27915 [Burkholderia stagnalis]|nr:hypothetical protein WT81_27915 [Burkholderia stagnalis]KWK53085.1 hypothetical protein WT80_08335 [Burkholderia stagnalis]
MRERAGVEHIGPGQPAAPRLSDAKLQVGEVAYSMCIGVDRHKHALLRCMPTPDISQIQALWLSIELKKTLTYAGVLDNTQEVDFTCAARFEEAACRMRQDREAWVIHRAQHTLCLGRARQTEMTVNGPDDQIEPRKHVVGQVKTSILKDVNFDTFQHHDIFQ